jgi:hypothetical protein
MRAGERADGDTRRLRETQRENGQRQDALHAARLSHDRSQHPPVASALHKRSLRVLGIAA